ncbi:hypothetical protein PhCBS80983_g01953 [Powellomyces hirtus]|uniref:Non-chaperonin molecular chaperone ATPase n=1 Tax=Powellomyces hirtus TaxID=109895 RepID=A0A507EAI2_9FUNG|nr:hypothetical protein PhCBS80983_g01953 [Powellomyces hirtus]
MARTKSSLPTLSWLAAILLLLLAVSTCVEAQSGPMIGIDLGSTHSSVGVYHESRNETRIHTIPSYVAFTQAGTCLVGQAAKNQSILNPSNTIFDTKRLIGRNFQDTDVQENLQRWPFIVIDRDGKPAIQVKVNGQDKNFRPEEVVARILQELKEWSEAYLGQPVTSAVIAVPAYFNDAQRQAINDAGTIAGLTVERIVNEPTAAAIAYGLDKKGGEQNILVYDLGGGTFDVSLLTTEDGVFEVLATSGDTYFGGKDFDNRVIEHFIRLWKKKTGKDCVEDLQAMVKLTQKVEEAKRVLSSEMSVRVEIESFHDGQNFSEVLTRANFEELNMDLFEKTLQPVEKVVKDAGLSTHEIHEILLVGGSSRIPKVVELVESYFDGKKVLKQDSHHGEKAIVHGAAMQGSRQRRFL